MSPTFRPPIWVWIALIISTGVSAYVASERFRSERSNRAVHLLADIADVRALALTSGETVPGVLKSLKDAGLTGMAIAEDTFDDLLLAGRLEPVPGRANRYRTLDIELAIRLRRVLSARTSGAAELSVIESPVGDITLPVWLGAVKTLGLGFDVETTRQIRSAGLSLVARLSNPPSATANSIESAVDEAKRVGAEGCLLAGDQVLGRRDLIGLAADKIASADLWFGAVEFSNQGGLPKLTRSLMKRTVRVHSMVAAEIDKNELPDILDRYVRSVVERSMRALFLRPVSSASENPRASFGDVISKIKNRLLTEGYEAKPVHLSEPYQREGWAALAMAFGLAIVSWWLLGRWISGIAHLLSGVVLFSLAAGTWFGFGSKYLALAGALAFPIWALLAVFSEDNAGGNKLKWLWAYFWIPLLCAVGGLHIAGLLTLPEFFLRLDQFSGVKAAHFLPPVAVGLALLAQRLKWREILEGKVRWLDAGLMLLVAVALLMMVMRTGNDAPGEVSGIELKMRSLLDTVLPERPRTKEFLLGYPALIVSLWMAATANRRFLPLAVLLAAVGQASVVNTFCHLHTPIEVSVMRVIVGMVAGGLVGAAVLFAYTVVRRAAR